MSVGLRLGFDPDFAPLTFLEGGKPGGRAVEIVRESCSRAGLGLELVPVGLGIRGATVTLALDGFVCMAVTPGRRDFEFSIPYLWTAAALFLRDREDEKPGNREGGVTVATPRRGPLFELLLQVTAGKEPGGMAEDAAAGALDGSGGAAAVRVTRVVDGSDYLDCLRRALFGEVDGAALNAEVGRAMVARLFPGAFVEVAAPLPDLGLAVAFGKAYAERKLVLSRLNPALEAVAGQADASRGTGDTGGLVE
ncbi:MAG: transporter substrate-binding domain-containing protein [Thermoleophilia bacterium]|nr:transporter substrate-binding domain-containing protein [Thermoleophilia bacterium]